MDSNSEWSLKFIYAATGAFLSIMLAVNGFFFTRLVDRLERIEENMYQLRQGVAVLEARFDGIKKK